MRVREMIPWLQTLDPEARVMVFDHLRSDADTTATIEVNGGLSMGPPHGPLVILCNEPED